MAEGEDDFEITPAMRRYLTAFDAWLRDQDDQDRLADRKVAFAGLVQDSRSWGRLRLDAAETARQRRQALTPRQQQVLRLRVHGLTAAAIAHVLGLSVNTVLRHYDGIRERLGTGNAFLQTMMAIEMGVIRPRRRPETL